MDIKNSIVHNVETIELLVCTGARLYDSKDYNEALDLLKIAEQRTEYIKSMIREYMDEIIIEINKTDI